GVSGGVPGMWAGMPGARGEDEHGALRGMCRGVPPLRGGVPEDPRFLERLKALDFPAIYRSVSAGRQLF
ncbi:hypothetical protein, partial [Deinococcus aerophilus]|uniref:hypothetical protein n=1 Tax=Deinococcus aerophilus TaxID=522488 RepID=UPI0027E4B394